MPSPPDEMRVFQRVIERGTAGAAADDLGVSPSAVSKLVTRLELRLGVRLINRTTRRLALTHEGEIYLERARDILRAVESAEAEIALTRASPEAGNYGLVRFRLLPSIVCRWFCRDFLHALSPHHIRLSGDEPVG